MISASNNNVIAELKVNADGTVVMNLLGAGTNAWASVTINFMADGAADWTAAAFENAWVDQGGAWDTAAYFKDAAGIVHIKGVIKNGTNALTAFTLPVGYRPKQTIYAASLCNGVIGNTIISENGTVAPNGANNTFYSVLNSFVAEQ